MSPVSQPLGSTRSRVCRQYALITPDTHVFSPLVGWRNASAVIHIAPEMGARFTQYTALLGPDTASASPGEGVQRCLYVLEGAVDLEIAGKRRQLGVGQFAFLPAGAPHRITTAPGKPADTVLAKLVVFEKRYQSTATAQAPQPVVGHARAVPGQPFMGDEALSLQVLLPVEPAYDMAVNIFTYQPGGVLPQVEIHVMEHGLLMLDGAGVYRLADDYHQVQAGDVIWMASYCPQWFVAMGKKPARYLYYKDIHRDLLPEKQVVQQSIKM